ncbi:MAG TPA: hypothetical protein VGO39_02210 [Gaiellaceae bacterium]|nr:hypothetical protein [Gaiellaceae bacterium]
MARADDGGGTSAAICADLQDGTLDGSYTRDQWNAFLSDPTVQGYCSVIVPPCVYPGSNGGTPPCAETSTTPTPQAGRPVPMTPVVIVRVKGAQHTSTTAQTGTRIRGAQHTAKAPLAAASTAPAATVKAGGTLPFTGAELAVFALVGLALLATGLLLRSTGRPTRRH